MLYVILYCVTKIIKLSAWSYDKIKFDTKSVQFVSMHFIIYL